MKEYIVWTQRDPVASTGFNPLALQRSLNVYAQLGWEVVSSSISVLERHGNMYTAYLIILEMDLPNETNAEKSGGSFK